MLLHSYCLLDYFLVKRYSTPSSAVMLSVFEDIWKIQCKLPPKTKRFCPLVLK